MIEGWLDEVVHEVLEFAVARRHVRVARVAFVVREPQVVHVAHEHAPGRRHDHDLRGQHGAAEWDA